MLHRNNKRSQKGEGQRGFTFIEVMISLLIVALMFGAFLAASTNYVNGTALLNQRMWAQQIAWNSLIALQNTRIKGSISDSKDTEQYFGQEWFLDRIISPTVTGNLVKVDMQVGLKEDSPITALSAFIVTGELGKESK